ncbi:hypothetical protein DXG01_016675, partial [Tephrocybe rancida]
DILESTDRGLRAAYQKYCAFLHAETTLREKLDDNSWVGQKPTNTEIIEIFVSKSMWHSHYSLFGKVSNHPLLIKWLDNDPDKPGDFELWGFEKLSYNFADLREYLKGQAGATEKASKKGKEKEKEKAQKEKKSSKKRT